MSETITYTQVGDYLIPDIRLSEPPCELTEPLGKYGRMRRSFLKEHRKITYSAMLLSEKLFPHLREVDYEANERLNRMMDVLAKQNPPPDKAKDQMGWVGAMNVMKAQAEESILRELIYD